LNYRLAVRRALLATAIVATLAPALPAVAAGPAAYQYPIRPGTAAWAALPDHAAMLRVTQLPAGLAPRLSTEQLVTTVLNYPLLRDAVAFNSVQQGLETVAGRFNGLAELLRRPDAGRALLGRYRTLDVHAPKAAPAIQGDHAYDVWAVESLLAQPQVLATLTPKQRETLLVTGEQAFAAKQADAGVYGTTGLEPSAVLLGRTLAVSEGWDWKQSTLLRDGIARTTAALDEVTGAVDAHQAEPGEAHPVGNGFGTLDHPSSVTTPNGTSIPVRILTGNSPPSIIQSNNQWVETHYPNATRLGDSTRVYNCHSYAWYSQSPTNNTWMNSPGDDAYWLDGSYQPWSDSQPPVAQLRWSWANDDHSGIEAEIAGDIRSKWGQLPLMYHRWDYSPYNRTALNKYHR